MKRITCLVLITIMVLSLGGCSKSSKSDSDRIRIGVTVYDQYDTFVASVVSEINEWANAKEIETGINITIDVVDAAGSQVTQNDQVADFILKDYDIVCVNLVDRTDTSMIIDKAKNGDVPVIFFNRELVDEDLDRWEKLYYVGADATQSGIMQGQIVVDICNKNFDLVDRNGDGVIQYVMLEGEAGHQDALIRTEYSVNTIVEAGYSMEKLADETANWKSAQAKNRMLNCITLYGGDIEVVLCNNDEMALGAIDAFDESHISDLPIIVGIDGSKDALLRVENKTLAGTVFNDSQGQGRAIIELAYSLYSGKELSGGYELDEQKSIRLPYRIVTKENVIAYMED